MRCHLCQVRNIHLPRPAESLEARKGRDPLAQWGPAASAHPMASRYRISGQGGEVDALAKTTTEAESHTGAKNRQGTGNAIAFDFLDDLLLNG